MTPKAVATTPSGKSANAFLIATAATRLPAQLDRMEQKGMAFHKRVRQGYLAQAERDPGRHLVIDGSRTEEEVFRSLLEGVGARLSTIVAAESAG